MTFLEQLQESAGLLGNQIQNVKPFGNYDPTLASDYVGGPMGLIPQNRFVGNQFQMPFPGGQSYTPGAMAPGGYNPLPYTPLPFNQGNVSTTQPGLLTQIEQALGGGGGDANPNNPQNQPNPFAYSTPNFQMMPGLLGLLGGLATGPQMNKFEYNPTKGIYEIKEFLNIPDDATTYNKDLSTMTMDKKGNVTYGSNPYGITERSYVDRPDKGPYGGASIGGGTSGSAGTAGGDGRGQSGGAMGGDNPGNTGGTSRF